MVIGDWLKEIVGLAMLVSTAVLAWKTWQQNGKAAERTAAGVSEATEVQRERLGLDVLEASLKRLGVELDAERAFNRQLVQCLRDAGIPVPERQYAPPASTSPT